MHFVMYAFSNHVGVLHNVTPIDGRIYESAPTTQSAVLLVRGLNFRADMQICPYHFHKLDGASG